MFAKLARQGCFVDVELDPDISGVSMKYSVPIRHSIALEEKSDAFVTFVDRLRVKPGLRGDLVKLIREIIHGDNSPIIAEWAALYRALARRDASDQAIIEARILWNEYRKSASVVPRKLNRGRHEDVVRSS